MLKEHYNPAPLEIAESFHFGTRVRKEGESIADFIVALKKLSIHCNFGVYLNRTLRDRFVCGLNYEKIQNRLLNTADLTFKLACETARAMEMSEQQAKEFVPGSAVHKVDKQQPWKRQGDTQGNTQGNAQSKARERCRHCNSPSQHVRLGPTLFWLGQGWAPLGRIAQLGPAWGPGGLGI